MDFRAKYNRDAYLNFFKNQLLPEDFELADEKLTDFKPDRIKSAVKIGEVPSLELIVLESLHESENDPRVSLSRETFRLLANHSIPRALVIFTSKNSDNFRLSLVTIDLKWEEGTRVKREYSNPKRFSFFLGPDSKVHTPQQYLKDRITDLEDLKKRFSIEVVNKEFYDLIASLFTILAGGKRGSGKKILDAGQGILKLPQTEDDTIKKNFAVRLIGRLIFCWFLKKKDLLPDELLSLKATGKNYYHNILEPLFFGVLNTPIESRTAKYKKDLWPKIPFLNGGLFTPHEDDFYDTAFNGLSKHLNTLIIPDDWLKKLFEVFETYNFTIDENTSVDVELSIEPEMLGRIFENLLAEINPETGETARKSTGSYYTPRPIVEYMVDESLKQYLLTKTNLSEEKISQLLSYSDEDAKLNDSQKDFVIDALHKIKIIDPACGSGAFPMGILQKILLILQKLDPDSKKWLDKLLSGISDPMYQKELKRKIDQPGYLHKLGIIRDCIYGVDIQSIAVEISKLRCFLSLIVDEKVDDLKPNRGVEHLPNLEFKFVCANTLIGLPKMETEKGRVTKRWLGEVRTHESKGQISMFEAADEISELKKIRDEYLNSYGAEKKNLEKRFIEIQSKLRQYMLQWGKTDTQTARLADWQPFEHKSCSWFDSEWMFGIKNGFDIVIANPPYVQIKQIPWDDRKIYEEKFASAVGRFNLFYFFLELSGNLAKQSGISTFIVPDRLLLNTQCDQLRIWLLKKQTILELDSFSEGVFEAVVDSIIIFYRNAKSEAKEVKVKNRVTLENLVQSAFVNIPVSYFLNSPSNQFDLSYNISTAKLLENIKSQSVPLGGISDIKDGIIQGKVTDKLFLDKPLDKDSKPLLFGEDVTKYSIRFNSNWVNYKPIEMMRIEVKRRGEGVRHGLWMRIPEIFERNKILTRQTADEIIAAYDTENYYYSNTLHGTTITNTQYHPLYVLALLNSKLITWYYRSTTAEEGKVFAQIKIELLRLLPIKNETNGNQKPFVSLVDQILKAKKTDSEADTSKLEAQIDEMVYKLYDLTPEEIIIIENG